MYCMGVYIPPANASGVEDLRAAWEACPANCKPILLGDLNICFNHPRDNREELIAELLDEIDSSITLRNLSNGYPNFATTPTQLDKAHEIQGDRRMGQTMDLLPARLHSNGSGDGDHADV